MFDDVKTLVYCKNSNHVWKFKYASSRKINKYNVSATKANFTFATLNTFNTKPLEGQFTGECLTESASPISPTQEQ